MYKDQFWINGLSSEKKCLAKSKTTLEQKIAMTKEYAVHQPCLCGPGSTLQRSLPKQPQRYTGFFQEALLSAFCRSWSEAEALNIKKWLQISCPNLCLC